MNESNDWTDCNPFFEMDTLEHVDFQRDRLVTNFVLGYFGKDVQVRWEKDREGNSEKAKEFIELASLFYGDAENNDERKNAAKKLFKMILELGTEDRIRGNTSFLTTQGIDHFGYEQFKLKLKEKIKQMDIQSQKNTKILEEIFKVLKIKELPTEDEDDDDSKNLS